MSLRWPSTVAAMTPPRAKGAKIPAIETLTAPLILVEMSPTLNSSPIKYM